MWWLTAARLRRNVSICVTLCLLSLSLPLLHSFFTFRLLAKRSRRALSTNTSNGEFDYDEELSLRERLHRAEAVSLINAFYKSPTSLLCFTTCAGTRCPVSREHRTPCKISGSQCQDPGAKWLHCHDPAAYHWFYSGTNEHSPAADGHCCLTDHVTATLLITFL